MENAEEILQCLDEFSKLKPKDIPRELEDYLCFVAKTGDPVYQWPLIKCLFREKLINVITEFYETCPTVEIPPCPNVDAFNYDAMKNFILEKLDTFAAAPFTVQRICELLTSPRKEYNRIDKYMRALEKNILVVSTREPGNRKSTENGESVVNGLESDHSTQDMVNNDVNVEVEMDETASWQKSEPVSYAVSESNIILDSQSAHTTDTIQDTYVSESKVNDNATCSSSGDSVITSRPINYIGYTPSIADLIIEPSSISNNSEPRPTPMNVENGEPPAETQNMTVFAMNSEYSVPVRPTQTEPEVDTETEAEAEAEAEVATVKEEPSASSVPPEPEPSIVQINPSQSESEVEKPPEPEPIAEPEVSPEASVQSEAEPSVQEEPESSTVVLQPQSSDSEPNPSESKSPSESTEQNETTISSTEQLPENSTDVQTPSTVEPEITNVSEATSEDQVSESNIESEYVVSQTGEPVVPNEEASMPTEESRQEVVTGQDQMQVDEVSTDPQTDN